MFLFVPLLPINPGTINDVDLPKVKVGVVVTSTTPIRLHRHLRSHRRSACRRATTRVPLPLPATDTSHPLVETAEQRHEIWLHQVHWSHRQPSGHRERMRRWLASWKPAQTQTAGRISLPPESTTCLLYTSPSPR